mgnify:FL=1
MDSQDVNTPIIGPAGTVHLSLRDLSVFASEHLKGLQGKSTLLVIVPNINTVVAITSNDGNLYVAEQCAWKITKEVLNKIHNNQ